MKGFKDSNNKFHPITQSKGIRKSRDQSAKIDGVKIQRKKRSVCVCGRGLSEFGDCERCGFNPEVCLDRNPTLGVENCFQIDKEEEPETEEEELRTGYDAELERALDDELTQKLDQRDYRDIVKGVTRKARYAFGDDEETQEITPDYSVGDIVMVSSDNDNEGYDDFRNKKLRITSVSTSIDEHQGFDKSVLQALYEFETLDGEEIGSSLYDYELVSA